MLCKSDKPSIIIIIIITADYAGAGLAQGLASEGGPPRYVQGLASEGGPRSMPRV